jgi:hypothetical protein
LTREVCAHGQYAHDIADGLARHDAHAEVRAGAAAARELAITA